MNVIVLILLVVATDAFKLNMGLDRVLSKGFRRYLKNIAIKDPSIYEKCIIETCPIGTELLKNLSCFKMEAVGATGSTMKVIQLGNAITDLESLKSTSNDIFVREFYPELFSKLRKTDWGILLSNPGVGKSWFQMYYMAALVNPAGCGLSKAQQVDYRDSCDPPDVVIRQNGATKMTVYFLKEQIAHNVKCEAEVLKCFDPLRTVYLYEPGRCKEEPFWVSMFDMQILATVSPEVSRYKEFAKNGATKLYMPLFNLKELQAIGKYTRSKSSFPTELSQLFTEAAIKKRFEEFGGIVRHVLPTQKENLVDLRKQRSEEIDDCDVVRLLSTANIEKEHSTSHLIACYNVRRRGKNAFELPHMEIFPSAELLLRSKMYAVGIKTRMFTLEKNDRTGFLSLACPHLYEGVVADHLTSANGVKWSSRPIESKAPSLSDWTVFRLKKRLSRLINREAQPPSYETMKRGVLYYPSNPNFPLIEMFYKEEGEEGLLIGFQVTREQKKSARKIDDSQVKALYTAIDMEKSLFLEKFRYYYCPCAPLADNFIQPKIECTGLQAYVLRLPTTYAAEDDRVSPVA